MTSRNNNQSATEEIYRIISKDPQAWLAQARQLKWIADDILPKLHEVFALPAASSQEQLACVHSYMLLAGLAFENLIKGVLIGRDPQLIENERIRKILKRGGHGIATAVSDVIPVSAVERNLLKRLEEYLIWAGRYPLPLQFGQYLNSEKQQLRRFMSSDPVTVNHLFEKVSQKLECEWRDRGNI